MKYHPLTEKVVDLLCEKVRIDERHYFRVLTTTYIGFIANTLHVQVELPEGEPTPVNVYSLLLATSGMGKTSSVNHLNKIIFDPFMSMYLKTIRKPVALKTIKSQSKDLALKHPKTFEDILDELSAMFEHVNFPNKFEKATEAAIRQQIDLIRMSGTGALNLIIDEISSNITSSVDALTSFLTIYDRGFSENKILKGSRENKQPLPLEGMTPANLLIFGNLVKLLDGSDAEKTFYSLMDTGYSRRLIYACVPEVERIRLTPQELMTQAKAHKDNNPDKEITDAILAPILKNKLKLLNMRLPLDDAAALRYFEYMNDCGERADMISEYESRKKAEIQNRYYKAIKIAGLYAFIDGKTAVTQEYLEYAIQLVEDCNDHFLQINTPKPLSVKLLHLLLHAGKQLNAHEIKQQLPAFPDTSTKIEDTIKMAVAACPSYQCIFQRTKINNIDYFSATKLEPVDLNKIIFAVSSHIAYRYTRYERSFEDLQKVCSNLKDGERYFTTHHLLKDHRAGENLIKGTNLLILDIDGTASIEQVQDLFSDYQYFIYTTKSHTEEVHRFRMLFPLSHKVYLDPQEYTEFMQNIIKDLPIEIDENATKDAVRAWAIYPNTTTYLNQGSQWNVCKYVPFSKEYIEHAEFNKKLDEANISRLERWFCNSAKEGNRNNLLSRYAFMLKDQNYDNKAIQENVLKLNNLFLTPLAETEIQKTIFKSATH